MPPIRKRHCKRNPTIWPSSFKNSTPFNISYYEMFRNFNIRYEINDYVFLIMILTLFNDKVFYKDGCLFVGYRSYVVLYTVIFNLTCEIGDTLTFISARTDLRWSKALLYDFVLF